MCRWLAYSGESLRPSELVLHPKHSLVAQSLDSPLGAETVNGDGFGFGWYPADPQKGNAPGVSRSIEPAWHDQNLRELTRAIVSPFFFSHVRAAAGPPIQQTNCHPFRFQNWLFRSSLSRKGSLAREVPPGWALPDPACHSRAGRGRPGAYAPRRWVCSFRRLWAAAASSHSLWQASRPRRDMMVSFWQVLIWPNTGSTVSARSS
jgi:hypothetical protein